jgi:hypothetical protein
MCKMGKTQRRAESLKKFLFNEVVLYNEKHLAVFNVVMTFANPIVAPPMKSCKEK